MLPTKIITKFKTKKPKIILILQTGSSISSLHRHGRGLKIGCGPISCTGCAQKPIFFTYSFNYHQAQKGKSPLAPLAPLPHLETLVTLYTDTVEFCPRLSWTGSRLWPTYASSVVTWWECACGSGTNLSTDCKVMERAQFHNGSYPRRRDTLSMG